ncbi:MAG: cadmium-translocating P-type ATPase [Bacteroidetes bacterium]|nr:cadmium-translocating P-type ATPase [Bacteroidota bacterium]
MKVTKWKVRGMDCSTCALNIQRYLDKEGMKNIRINFVTGDLQFEQSNTRSEELLKKGIERLGYAIEREKNGSITTEKTNSLSPQLIRFLLCLPPTLLLLFSHTLSGWINLGGWLHNPWAQLGLTIPVYAIGMHFFGASAWKSIRNRMPNMNVLITLGATAAFGYSLYGSFSEQAANFMFYETAATIITLVFLGNYLEDASIASTQRALQQLVKSQKVMATMIAFDDEHREQYFSVENTQLQVGDLILIKTGEQVPIDCKILWGELHANESIITGESLPVRRLAKDRLIGGSLVTEGTVKAQVTATGDETVLAGIIQLVKEAQGEKPPVQQLADRISTIFIPSVLIIAAGCFALNYLMLNDLVAALLRSIAVLVIACPCAMGLATPAAIAVGLGRAARSGILFRNAKSLELFQQIEQVVFDKTGTLTTGQFVIGNFHVTDSATSQEQFKFLAYSLEKYSNHPIAQCVSKTWKTKDQLQFKKIEEIKGLGMIATDLEGNTYSIGSWKMVEGLTQERAHNLYLQKNNTLLGWLDIADQVRPEAHAVINYLHRKKINTILLSGDTLERCEKLAQQLGIDVLYAEKSPADKLTIVESLNLEKPTVMVGDGINDAPALAKATISISMNDASQLAVQTAQVVLMNQGLKKLPAALGLGRHTYLTIKQNLFWAFAYNVIAIPVAAFGYLTPTFGALVMGLSDVVLAINSVRLFVKRVE